MLGTKAIAAFCVGIVVTLLGACNKFSGKEDGADKERKGALNEKVEWNPEDGVLSVRPDIPPPRVLFRILMRSSDHGSPQYLLFPMTSRIVPISSVKPEHVFPDLDSVAAFASKQTGGVDIFISNPSEFRDVDDSIRRLNDSEIELLIKALQGRL